MQKPFILAALLGIAMTPAQADDIALFAAGSLKAALSDVAADYTEAYATPVATSFGPSGLMRERIETGEAAHVFASANMRHPKILEAAGKAVRSPFLRATVFARWPGRRLTFRPTPYST